VYVTRLCMGGIHTVWAAHTRSLSGKKFSSIISLEAALHHFPHGAACVGNNKVVCYQMTFYFFPFLFSFPFLKNYILVIFIVDILTWVLILLILNFCSWSCIKVLFVFNFIHQFQFDIYYFFQVGSYFLNF